MKTIQNSNHGYGSRNDEGELWLEMMQANHLVAINTCFKKRPEHLLTYKSGSNSTQVDYIMVRVHDRKRVKNAKVLPYEAVTKQQTLGWQHFRGNWKSKTEDNESSKDKSVEPKRQMEDYNKAIKEYSPMELQDDKTVDEIWGEMSRVLYVTRDWMYVWKRKGDAQEKVRPDGGMKKSRVL